MCGLVGTYHPISDKICSINVIEQMRDKMTHRGPDGAGVWLSRDGRCAFGHRRLSIIDLSNAASQPMSNQSGTVTVVYNGEIYNHQELRSELQSLGKYQWTTDHSDTEVLLHAYEEWGLACLDRFYGMFAFAIYDTRNRERPVLHLVRDRMGVKPLYISRTNEGEWVFGSEIRALLSHPHITPEMDRTAFWHYLSFIVTPAPLTLFRGIFKIPNGHVVTINHQGHAVAKRWWDCRPSARDTLSETDISFEEATQELTRLLKAAVKRRMVSDVPFGMLLSGGVDSSLTTALMSEMMERPVTTFTVGYEQYEEFNEFETAKRISRRYGTQHFETRINSQEALDFLPKLVQLQDEPIADNVCIPLYFLSKLVKESGTTVVQVGEGADEHFLGYWWCDHYRQKYENVYQPILTEQRKPWWKKAFTQGTKSFAHLITSNEDREIVERAKLGQELFWGGAICFWGDLRREMTPDTKPFEQNIDCPIENLIPNGVTSYDSHSVVKDFCANLEQLAEPNVLQKISYIESRLRLPEHLLMRVDKMTMAHSVEARVPFLDHEVVNFARRLPLSYKLQGGIGKRIIKKAAEPYVDHDLLYQRKRGFGAPMDKWFAEKDFSRRCLAAFERSRIAKEGFLNNDLFKKMLKQQSSGSGGQGFHLWTILNAVLWYDVWIEGNKDCL